MKKIISLFLIVACCLMILGCGKKYAKTYEVKQQAGIEVNNDNLHEGKPLAVSFTNKCGEDFGLLSIMDSVTKEQSNIDSLADGESIEVELIQAVDINELKWAVYDLEGNLVAECTTDITDADNVVKITLLGNGQFNDVDVKFE